MLRHIASDLLGDRPLVTRQLVIFPVLLVVIVVIVVITLVDLPVLRAANNLISLVSVATTSTAFKMDTSTSAAATTSYSCCHRYHGL